MSLSNPIVIDYNCPHWAYILGYLWGDGHVPKRRGAIILGIKETDYVIIADSINRISNGRACVYLRKRGQPQWSQCVAIHLSSVVLWDQLSALGYRDKINQTAVLTNLNPTLHSLFWRGYFDADGTLRLKEHGAEVSFCSCYDETWDAVTAWFTQLNLSKWRIERVISKQGHRYSKIHIERELDLAILLKYLYSPGVGEDLGLPRKQTKAQDILAAIHTHALSRIRIRMQRSCFRYRSISKIDGIARYVSGSTPNELHRNVLAMHRARNSTVFRTLKVLGLSEKDIINDTTDETKDYNGTPVD